VQFVPFDQRAWHAGVSSFEGREGCNDFSIGIELEGDDVTPYTDQQYLALGLTVVELIEAYGIPSSHIVGHCDIAPNRKTDPGPVFQWSRLRRDLAQQGIA
jgi:AmpD protein